LFVALSHLRKNKIIHADIKPDNILISKDTKLLKLCDFGTAFTIDEATMIEYLVSRFYRSPEIIIGYPYDTSVDMWSAGCTLFELYTGEFLFPGNSNNEMVSL
jgi:serine/threonine-protein kinase PRP4